MEELVFILPPNVRFQEKMSFQGREARGTFSSDNVLRSFRPFLSLISIALTVNLFPEAGKRYHDESRIGSANALLLTKDTSVSRGSRARLKITWAFDGRCRR